MGQMPQEQSFETFNNHQVSQSVYQCISLQYECTSDYKVFLITKENLAEKGKYKSHLSPADGLRSKHRQWTECNNRMKLYHIQQVSN